MKRTAVWLACAALLISACFTDLQAQSADEVLTNDQVITMTKAGLGPAIIANKVRGSKGKYNLSIDNLMALKKAGVADEVVTAMLEVSSGRTAAAPAGGGATMVATSGGDPNDPMTAHDYGVYLYEEIEGTKRMTRLEPTVSAQNRTGGGFTAAVTPFGLGKVKTKANLPGNSSKVSVRGSRPTFYFYLDTKSGGFNTASGIPSTTNEFMLVRFNVRDDNRELTIGKANAYGAKGGISDEYVVQFSSEKVGEGIFKVVPAATMKDGEYGFFLINSGNSNASSAVGSKFFDFAVKAQ